MGSALGHSATNRQVLESSPGRLERHCEPVSSARAGPFAAPNTRRRRGFPAVPCGWVSRLQIHFGLSLEQFLRGLPGREHWYV